MIVMKFGGMTTADANAIGRVVRIVQDRLSRYPIVVNSAIGKTTRNLLDIARLSASGETRRAEEKLEEIHSFHDALIHDVLNQPEASDSLRRLSEYHAELQKLLHGMTVLKDLTPRSLDHFLSYGERIATAIITEHLRQEGIAAVLTDARTYMITDDRFGQARPVEPTAAEKIRRILIPLVESGKVPVVQGYIGATESGATTTLGFEGSDFSATFIGASVQAEEIQIWKDVPGIMTTDPAIYPDVRTVKRISFEAAAELTLFGAKVLHPAAIAPARRLGIPVSVNHVRHPDAEGTKLSSESFDCPNAIQSITYKRSMSLFRAVSNWLLAPNEFLRNVYTALDREGVTSFLTTATASSVSLALETGDSIPHIEKDLGRFSEVTFETNKATVTLVGESLRKRRDIVFELIRLIDGFPVHMMVHSASPINITLLIDEADLNHVITRIHKHFFEEADPNIYEG